MLKGWQGFSWYFKTCQTNLFSILQISVKGIETYKIHLTHNTVAK